MKKAINIFNFCCSFLLLIHCSKTKNNINNEKEILDTISHLSYKEDSIALIRKKTDANSLLILFPEKIYSEETLNLSIQDLDELLNSTISNCEDLLILKNWRFLSKEKFEKPNYETKGFEKMHEMIRGYGTLIKYRNYENDSDIEIFISEEKIKNNIIIETLNKYNYISITLQLHQNNFISKEGSSIFDYEAFDGLNKKYIGEFITVNGTVKEYKKNNLECKTFLRIMSPITEIRKDSTQFGGYANYYDANNEKEKYNINFSFHKK